MEPDDPSRDTLRLEPSGGLRIRADCNRYGGTDVRDDGAITLEVRHGTRAACPPTSLKDQFLRQLANVRIGFMQGERLHLDLFADAGTMEITR